MEHIIMGEGEKIDLKSLFAGAAKVVGQKLQEGVKTPSTVMADGQESSALIVPAEAKAETASVASGEKRQWKNVQEFVESILDGSEICLENKKGLRRVYKRKGDKLYNEDGNNVTREAFKRICGDWVLVEGGTITKNPTASAESGATTTVVGAQSEGSQLEESESLKVFREKLDSFDSKFEEMLQKANTLTALKSLYNHVKSKKTTSDGKSIYLSEVIWHNFLSEITPVYSPLPPEQKKVASSLLEEKNNEYAVKIKRKEKGFKDLKEQEFYQIRNDKKEFPKIVDKKVSEITEKIELAQSLTELENIGQVRSISKNKKERRFLSAEMFVDIENDPAMIVHINRVFDVEEDAVEKRILACWEERFQALTSERKAVKKQFDDVIEEKRRLAKERLGDSSDKLLRKEYTAYMDHLEQLGQDANAAFERNDIEELNRALRAVGEIKFVVEGEGRKNTQSVTAERREYSDEELFPALVRFLQKQKSPFAFFNPEIGEKLAIVSVSDGAIKCRHNEDKIVRIIAPKNIKDFLQFLDDRFHWRLKMPRAKGEKAVSAPAEPAPAVAGAPAGTIPDIDESGLVNPYYAGLKVSVEEPVVAPRVKNESIHGDAQWEKIVSPVNEMIESNPFEGLNESEEDPEEEPGQTEEEKRYEELIDLLEYTEYWSTYGVVADALERVSAYSRKTGKSKGDIVDEMGGMDLAAEKILMEAIQKVLPSGWSKDDKEFYSRKFALELLEIFVEEDEEKTEK